MSKGIPTGKTYLGFALLWQVVFFVAWIACIVFFEAGYFATTMVVILLTAYGSSDIPDRLAVAQSKSFGGQRLSFADDSRSRQSAETLSTAVLAIKRLVLALNGRWVAACALVIVRLFPR
ncbi:hypothetical protein IVB12_11110 [Bradyrhizobium sp. 179]|uniref:hypothetical protein n=1 Tax=Bradyrhizobium sp. 179 TaxID=2782648 RepID=UPI001FFA63CA|nr:hypothetical protein [Bradyrhizobium sp. 179]MCK1542483.1 hypothetical protein [Bradyrhizobium sp. 179]